MWVFCLTFLKSSGDPAVEVEAASWRRGWRSVAVGMRLVTVLIPSTSLSTGGGERERGRERYEMRDI